MTPACSSDGGTLFDHGGAQVLLERLEVEQDGLLRHQDEVELCPYIMETLDLDSEVLQHLKKKEVGLENGKENLSPLGHTHLTSLGVGLIC